MFLTKSHIYMFSLRQIRHPSSKLGQVLTVEKLAMGKRDNSATRGLCISNLTALTALRVEANILIRGI